MSRLCKQLLGLALGSLLCAASGLAQERPLDQHALFTIVARLYNLDPALLEAIATVESNGDSRAISPKGAQGLMQLMPETAHRFRVADPFDPVDNALGAARFLDYLRRMQSARSDLDAGLVQFIAAYNAGEGAVEKYKGVPPYPETRQYVQRVLREYMLRHSASTAVKQPNRAPARRPHLTNAEVDRRLLDQLGRIRQLRASASTGQLQ